MARIVPTPGVVRPGPWQVSEHPELGHGDTNLSNFRMRVPLADTPGAAFVRRHEVAHAAITPNYDPLMKARKRKGLPLPSVSSLQVAEDHRLDEYLSHCGFPILDPEFGDYKAFVAEKINKAAEAGDIYMAACMAVAAYAALQDSGALYDVHPKVRRVLSMLDGPMIEARCTVDSWRFTRRKRERYTPVIELAVLLDGLRTPPPPPSGPNTPKGKDGATVQWGTMEMCEPTRAFPHDAPYPESISSMQGFDLADPSRIFTDCRPFERTVESEPQGSFLIDCSSSMMWTPEKLEKLIRERPEASVALYSGARNTGKLIIVAKDGMTADPREAMSLLYGGNNTVDGPALQWLADQPGPRYWYSDGCATQPNGNHAAAGIECIRICAENSIERIEKIPD